MDTLITFDEVVALLANPPTLDPHPNFANLRALRRHMQRALQRLSCPQRNILGWAGQSCHEPCTPSSPQLHFDSQMIPAHRPCTTAQGPPSSTHRGTRYLTRRAIRHTSRYLRSIEPPRQQSTRDSFDRATTGSHTRISNELVLTCSMITSTTPSRSRTA